MFVKCVAIAALAVAPALAANWTIIDSDIGFEGIGLSFISESTGYAGGASVNGHPSVFKTTNGGVNWAITADYENQIQLVLDVDAVADSVVVATAFGEQYSDDGGQTWGNSTGGGVSMSVRFLGVNGDGGLQYGVTGTYAGKQPFSQFQGVGISNDGGKTFTTYNSGCTAIARFGAFPSDSVWYVAAGTWPNENQEKVMHVPSPARRRAPAGMPQKNGKYEAQIAKTTDGGATWSIVFNRTNEFFFNSIDCASETYCCAAAEGDEMSTAPGARIFCTSNGGVTWNQTFFKPGKQAQMYSILDLQFSSPTEIWAGGAILDVLYPSSWFLYSNDAGLTWSTNYPNWAGMYVEGLSFLSNSSAYALLQDYLAGNAQVAKFE